MFTSQINQSINKSINQVVLLKPKHYNNASECKLTKWIGDKGRPKRNGDPAKEGHPMASDRCALQPVNMIPNAGFLSGSQMASAYFPQFHMRIINFSGFVRSYTAG